MTSVSNRTVLRFNRSAQASRAEVADHFVNQINHNEKSIFIIYKDGIRPWSLFEYSCSSAVTIFPCTISKLQEGSFHICLLHACINDKFAFKKSCVGKNVAVCKDKHAL